MGRAEIVSQNRTGENRLGRQGQKNSNKRSHHKCIVEPYPLTTSKKYTAMPKHQRSWWLENFVASMMPQP